MKKETTPRLCLICYESLETSHLKQLYHDKCRRFKDRSPHARQNRPTSDTNRRFRASRRDGYIYPEDPGLRVNLGK
jgi:hypothetical protein